MSSSFIDRPAETFQIRRDINVVGHDRPGGRQALPYQGLPPRGVLRTNQPVGVRGASHVACNDTGRHDSSASLPVAAAPVRPKRRLGRSRRHFMDAACLVFPDGTATATTMARRYGRCPTFELCWGYAST